MKQILIGKNKPYATSPAVLNDATAVGDGVIGIYTLNDNKLVSGKAPASDFCIVLGRAGKMPLIFPEVNLKSLTVEKATSSVGAKFSATIPVASVVKDKKYTIMIVKKGVVRHERNTWTATTLAQSTNAVEVMKDLAAQFNARTETSNVKVTTTSTSLIFTGVNTGEDFEIVCCDELMGVKPSAQTTAKPAILDKAYVEDLASRCAAGKGFNLTALEGRDINVGYPEPVEDVKYTMYTLRFAVPRVAAKQRDEVVYQIVHIVVPEAASAVSALDTIFGISTPGAGA